MWLVVNKGYEDTSANSIVGVTENIGGIDYRQQSKSTIVAVLHSQKDTAGQWCWGGKGGGQWNSC